MDEVGWRELSEGGGKSWRKQEGVIVGQPGFLCLGNPTPRHPLQGNLAIRAGAGPQGSRGPLLSRSLPLGPALYQGSVLETSSLGHKDRQFPGQPRASPG